MWWKSTAPTATAGRKSSASILSCARAAASVCGSVPWRPSPVRSGCPMSSIRKNASSAARAGAAVPSAPFGRSEHYGKGNHVHRRPAGPLRRGDQRAVRHPQGRHRDAHLLLLLRPVRLRRLPDVRGGGRAGQDRDLLLHEASGWAVHPHQHCPAAEAPPDDPGAAAGLPQLLLHHLREERRLPPPGAGHALRRAPGPLWGQPGGVPAGRQQPRRGPGPQQVHPVRRLCPGVRRDHRHGHHRLCPAGL